ncbi:hypothetical protein T265_15012, partial [Opisthorchis viverrini]
KTVKHNAYTLIANYSLNHSLSTAGRRISLRSFTATLDSTTFLSKASVERTSQINTALGATLSGNLYVVDCNQVGQLPALVMSFQGVQLNLTPEQYIQRDEVQGQARCFSSIVADPAIKTERMTLGMSFMEHFITMFDQQENKVGFKPRICCITISTREQSGIQAENLLNAFLDTDFRTMWHANTNLCFHLILRFYSYEEMRPIPISCAFTLPIISS